MNHSGTLKDRKRSLETPRRDGRENISSKYFQLSSEEMVPGSTEASDSLSCDQSVLDEIDLHFKRSLANTRNQQQKHAVKQPLDQLHSSNIFQKHPPSEPHQIIVADNPIVASTKTLTSEVGSSISTGARLHTQPSTCQSVAYSTPIGRVHSTTTAAKGISLSTSSQPTTTKRHEKVAIASSPQPMMLAPSASIAAPLTPQAPVLPLVDLYSATGSPLVLFPGALQSSLQIPPQSFVLVNPSDISQAHPLFDPSSTTVATGNLAGAGRSGNIVQNPVPGSFIFLPPTTSYQGISNQQTISLPSNPTSSVPAENITKDVTQETADGSILKSPASVDDHFAKALGEQWTRVKKTGAVQNTVAS